MTEQPIIRVHKYGARITVPAGFFAPTEPRRPDPEREARRATAGMVIPASIRRLDALADPVSRAVLDLHARRPEVCSMTGWACHGDELNGYEAEHPDWPCATVEAVAAVHGIDLTDVWLYERPADGSLDLPTPEDQ